MKTTTKAVYPDDYVTLVSKINHYTNMGMRKGLDAALQDIDDFVFEKRLSTSEPLEARWIEFEDYADEMPLGEWPSIYIMARWGTNRNLVERARSLCAWCSPSHYLWVWGK